MDKHVAIIVEGKGYLTYDMHTHKFTDDPNVAIHWPVPIARLIAVALNAEFEVERVGLVEWVAQ